MVRSLLALVMVGGFGLCVADEITAARIERLPEATRATWQAYLDRSRAAAAWDRDALAAEVAAAGLDAAVRPPNGGDFRPREDADPTWYQSPDAEATVAAVLSYQSPNGGWSKHLGYAKAARQPGMQWTSQSEPGKRPHYLATIDNGATTKEIRFLADVWAATGRKDCEAAVNRGIDYLLEAQFPSGGWPQVYPLEGGYHDNITFNDDAMTNVLVLLHEVADENPLFACVEPARRARAAEAVARGIDCLLASQIERAGQPAGWCAQHDPISLAPAQGRAYEPPSLGAVESSHLLRFLMELPRPSAEVIACIEAGLAWLDEAQVHGLARVKQNGRTLYVEQPGSNEVYWARFYDLASGKPIYPGKNGVIYDSFEALAAANDKLGYDYLSTQPGSILRNGQTKWRKRLTSAR
jgi:PelA/Pel-15E family pectate lyase